MDHLWPVQPTVLGETLLTQSPHVATTTVKKGFTRLLILYIQKGLRNVSTSH